MKTDKMASLYYRAPQDLREKVSDLARLSRRPKTAFIFNFWLKTVAVAASVIFLIWVGRISKTNSPDELLTQEIVATHVRSLMAEHLIDIASTDRHTVKPWFSGRLDFSPKVLDFSPQKFSLIGGRLEYLNSRPVAALVYQHDKHVINLFTWPASDLAERNTTFLLQQGFSIFRWVSHGMNYWVISDLNPNDLKSFTELVRND